ncbi:hypothetical protein [Roseomonas gilardii]|nr:hypothetical protein [Roseomonas gilardii]
MTAQIWILRHYRAQAHEDERDHPQSLLSMKAVGTYSSLAKAEAAIRELLPLPGFRDWPGGFRIYEVTLDRDLWPEGFAGTKTGERPGP